MLKLESVLTKLTLPLTLTLLVSGCAIVPNSSAICDGTERLRDAHTEALLADGGDKSVLSGAALIAALDAGCGV